jgi:hypothetical protein
MAAVRLPRSIAAVWNWLAVFAFDLRMNMKADVTMTTISKPIKTFLYFFKNERIVSSVRATLQFPALHLRYCFSSRQKYLLLKV